MNPIRLGRRCAGSPSAPRPQTSRANRSNRGTGISRLSARTERMTTTTGRHDSGALASAPTSASRSMARLGRTCGHATPAKRLTVSPWAGHMRLLANVHKQRRNPSEGATWPYQRTPCTHAPAFMSFTGATAACTPRRVQHKQMHPPHPSKRTWPGTPPAPAYTARPSSAGFKNPPKDPHPQQKLSRCMAPASHNAAGCTFYRQRSDQPYALRPYIQPAAAARRSTRSTRSTKG